MKKTIFIFCIILFTAGTGFAADFTTGPEAVQPGNVFFSFGYAHGTYNAQWTQGGVDFEENYPASGFAFSVDYVLSQFGLTIGGELGFIMQQLRPVWALMGRIGYHPDLGVPKLDVYALAKLGYAINSSIHADSGGLAAGIGIGGRYFFGSNLAIFSELGFDSYSVKEGSGYGSEEWVMDIKYRRFFTIGLTYRVSK